jgi:phage baseplate assembly protein W
MADLVLRFGGDLVVGATGDLLLADGETLTQQRVLRRILTNPGDYIWQLDYGAGLAQFIGQPGAPAAIAGVVRTQIQLERAVAATPAAVVNVAAGDDGIMVLSLSYTNAVSEQTSLLTFSL